MAVSSRMCEMWIPPNWPGHLRQLDHLVGGRERPRHVEAGRCSARTHRRSSPARRARASSAISSASPGRIDVADDVANGCSPARRSAPKLTDFGVASSFARNGAERHWRRSRRDLRSAWSPPGARSCRRSASERCRARACVWMSMNPGASTCPATSIILVAGSSMRRRDACDGVPVDRHVGTIPGAPGAVDDASVAEQQVVGRRLGGRPGRTRDGRNHRSQEQSRPAVPSSQAVRSIGHASPESLQKREEVSVTSARAHAFFSRCSTRAASSLLPCATSAWCTPKSAHPFSRLRRRSSQ